MSGAPRVVPVSIPVRAAPATGGTAPPPKLEALPPLSLYVHLPWCLLKCPYCDFNSHEWRAPGRTEGPAAGSAPDTPLQTRYRKALELDLDAALPLIWGRTVHSIFIGGGTPSLFDPSQIDALLASLRARLRLEPGCEITLEANPGTFERERFRAYAQAGVTRLSIGVQSFDDQALRALGRVHDGAQARAAVQEARESFSTWNLDLMYALPGQTLQGLEEDLRTALSFEPPHLSIYHLTLEPNTRFANDPPPNLPHEDVAWDMLDHLVAACARHGLQRYEVSAFARESHRCTHNLNYWRFGDYLGIGAGAHSKLSFPDRIVRQVRRREPQGYMQAAEQGQAVSNEQAIGAEDRPFEFMLNGLRLIDGVSLQTFRERTGLGIEELEPALSQAVQRGLLVQQGLRVQPTARGLDFLSDLQSMFLPTTAP